MSETKPFFSVVIPTRDRVELFKLALDSVVDQKFDGLEIHVVNDGSTEPHLGQYKSLSREYGDNVHFHYLTHRPNGHGQSYSINYGVDKARGQYICCLDDDDYWVDPEHLARAAQSINQCTQAVDLYFTNQKAYYSDGRQNQENVWIEDLIPLLSDRQADAQGSYSVDTAKMLTSGGFAHLNCSIYRKELWQKIKGMDEGIRYECDRDVYLRGLDAAENILFNPAYISRHHIPDPKNADNMSTMISIYEKKLYQLRVYDKGVVLSFKPELIDFCRRGKGNELKHIAEAMHQEGRYRDALYYALQGLGALPTIKWLGFTVFLAFKRLTG